jgi:polar amino acid transport system substrate-binding protein
MVIGKAGITLYTILNKPTFFGGIMRKTTITAIAILAAMLVPCGGCQKKSTGMTIQPGTLMIGMEIGYPPMEYYGEDGRTPVGFDVEMGKAVAKKMGLTAEFVDTAWDGIFDGVETKKYDCIMSSVTINEPRLRAHNFSKPYVSNTLAMVLLKGSTVNARNPMECVGLDVAYQLETTSDDYMRGLEEQGLAVNHRRYEKVMYCFDELKLKRVDVIVTDLLVAYDYIAPEDSPFEIVWTSTDDEKFGICMKKGNDALTEAVNNALDALFEDGTMLAISNKIFGMDLVSAARQ